MFSNKCDIILKLYNMNYIVYTIHINIQKYTYVSV